jgi:sigma-B regulation protein RsbU (phosphoserine phosphatase)
VYIALVSFFIALLGISSVSGNTDDNSIAVFFMSALLVAFLFTPARNYLQQLIDRIFFRHKLDYPRLVTQFSRALTTSLLLDDLLEMLTETIPGQLSLRGGKVLLNISTLPKDCVECKTMEQGRLIWLNRELHRNPSDTLPAPLDKLKQDGLWSCVPLLSGDNLMGIYGVGPKKSGEYYSREDIALLETVGRQAGVALQNAQLHKELSNQARIQRDLEIASQIQQRLLPRQDPQISGLEIVSYSRPAQEVGGDFHHYVKFSNEHIGVAVGDVSGKGVPAALFMAVSISTLRAEVPHYENNVAALLVAMNDILFPQMSVSDVNTAMLYATLEKQASNGITLSVSNAGLIWPVLRRSGRQVNYINVSGLPMGALPNVRYQTFELDLLPGDLVILSTDGIVEAMNRQREMFGFERFEESIARCRKGLSATDVLEKVIDDVFTFIGNAEPHDDMTLVAIRVI